MVRACPACLPAAHGTVCLRARSSIFTGTDRLTVSGDANNIIRTIISRIGLSTVFDVPSETSGITLSNYSFRRYITAWDGLRMMLTAQGARLT